MVNQSIKCKSLILTIFIVLSVSNLSCSDSTKTEEWLLGPFVKQDSVNPCLTPDEESTFKCPIRNKMIHWEEKDVFNAAAVVRDGKIYLLYRAEDTIGKHAGTSRIGIAESTDGLNFTTYPEPVLYPDNDFMKKYEWEGGCEDPRIVEDERGIYYMTYTAWNGELARLCVGTSSDLKQWNKHGLVFDKAGNGKYRDRWSKSGSIICELKGNRLVAKKIDGKYWMYWGESDIYIATSDDLINWEPLEDENGELVYLISTRRNKFDSQLVEPGPPALLTEEGIVFIYNSKNSALYGDKSLPHGTYAAGQVLIDRNDPTKLIDRTENYFFKPERSYEMTGQVNNVCFLEGLVFFQGTWYLYYGTADSKIAVAVYKVE
ncbi:glycosidase [candidate division KSB1 bacterium]|nr:glycosidase [candidate division KSB1 bacterium]